VRFIRGPVDINTCLSNHWSDDIELRRGYPLFLSQDSSFVSSVEAVSRKAGVAASQDAVARGVTKAEAEHDSSDVIDGGDLFGVFINTEQTVGGLLRESPPPCDDR
jgi:hypothetical protein